jgi:hypothetical protein
MIIDMTVSTMERQVEEKQAEKQPEDTAAVIFRMLKNESENACYFELNEFHNAASIAFQSYTWNDSISSVSSGIEIDSNIMTSNNTITCSNSSPVVWSNGTPIVWECFSI